MKHRKKLHPQTDYPYTVDWQINMSSLALIINLDPVATGENFFAFSLAAFAMTR